MNQACLFLWVRIEVAWRRVAKSEFKSVARCELSRDLQLLAGRSPHAAAAAQPRRAALPACRLLGALRLRAPRRALLPREAQVRLLDRAVNRGEPPRPPRPPRPPHQTTALHIRMHRKTQIQGQFNPETKGKIYFFAAHFETDSKPRFVAS